MSSSLRQTLRGRCSDHLLNSLLWSWWGKTRWDSDVPGLYKRLTAIPFHLLPSSFPQALRCRQVWATQLLRGWARFPSSSSWFPGLCLFQWALELPSEEPGKRLCMYMNHSLALSLKPSSPSYLAAMQNESASRTPAPRATFPVTETNVTLDQDMKTHLD